MKPVIWTLGCALVGALAGCSREPAPAPLGFNDDIRPILAENCFQCHGPDPGARKADLRLDRPEFAFRPDKDGAHAIVKGDPDRSLLIQRVMSDRKDRMMPPPETHKTLAAAQIERLRRWIREGAPYQEHWAFIKPALPPVPSPRRADWARNEIDRFVLAKLEQEGLAPSPEADRYALIRRVAFDLTGLPPTPGEVGAFLSDGSPGAYEQVVDRYLASPHFGEHRAHYWLDAVRYGDTNGPQYDNIRYAWPYRDYVIAAFNHNKPFDRFVMEQIAGDLMPAESLDQIVATGFNRAHLTTNEAGSIIEELQLNKAKDRAETVASVFLGLTVGCAACHDHKFDPITQQDYYSLTAFFNHSTDYAYDNNDAAAEPTVTVPPDDHRAEAERLIRERGAVDRKLAERRAQAPILIAEWLKDGGAARLHPVSTEKLVGWFPLDEGAGKWVHNAAPGAHPAAYAMGGDDFIWDDTILYWSTLRFDLNTTLAAAPIGDFDASDAFSAGGWFLAREDSASRRGALLSRMSQAEGDRGWDLRWEDASTPPSSLRRERLGKIEVNLIHDDALGGIRVRARRLFGARHWTHWAFTYDGSGKAAGVRLYADGEPLEVDVLRDNLSGSIRTAAPFQLGRRTGGDVFVSASYQDIRVYGRGLSPDEMKRVTREDIVCRVLRKPPSDWNVDERRLVEDFYFRQVDALTQAWRAQRTELERRFEAACVGGVPTMISEEKPGVPLAHRLDRGVYSAYRERVRADVPHVLPPLPPGAPHNRLGLAEWLVSRENPLTARVTVNRMWQEIFGTGLVDTPQDFGTTGSRPSHPALLDWLAVEFEKSGWDVKRFYKRLVMSATYRQAAPLTPRSLERDPANRLLARGPRFRLDAEEIRDQALAASGLLIDRVGGRGNRTYQPDGLWQAVAFDRSNTRVFQPDSGDALYRRSVYTFWKRTSAPPILATFDAPLRDTCVIRRDRTDTPLQALATENSPDFLEAARHLAARAMRARDAGEEARVNYMASVLLTRPLAEPQRKLLAGMFERFEKHFADAAVAREFLAQGDSAIDPSLPPDQLAAWTLVASQLINTDAALNK